VGKDDVPGETFEVEASFFLVFCSHTASPPITAGTRTVMCSIKASLQVYRSRGTEGQQHKIARSTVRFGENTDTRRQSKKVWWRTQVVYTPWDSWILSLSVCLFYFVVLNRYYYDWGIEWMKISFVTVPEFPCQAAMFFVFGLLCKRAKPGNHGHVRRQTTLILNSTVTVVSNDCHTGVRAYWREDVCKCTCIGSATLW